MQYALFALKSEDVLFDGMNAMSSNFSYDSQRPVLFDPRRSGRGEHRYSAGAECEPGRRSKLDCLVRLRELRHRPGLYGAVHARSARPHPFRGHSGAHPLVGV